jgi:hypothetical protein
MTHYPLLFGFRDIIQGDGFLARVAVEGRALMLVDEPPEKVWIEGVNPGGFAASGHSSAEALEEFRQSYLAVLFDIAADAGDFETFRRGVEEFFHDTNEPASRDWETAVEEVRAGRTDTGWLAKRPADSPQRIEVVRVEQPTARDNQLGEGAALAA